MVFKATDNLPIETNGEFAKANNFIKNNLNTIEFLDKTLRGQIVKGGRLTKLGGRVVGGIVGSAGGFGLVLLGKKLEQELVRYW